MDLDKEPLDIKNENEYIRGQSKFFLFFLTCGGALNDTPQMLRGFFWKEKKNPTKQKHLKTSTAGNHTSLLERNNGSFLLLFIYFSSTSSSKQKKKKNQGRVSRPSSGINLSLFFFSFLFLRSTVETRRTDWAAGVAGLKWQRKTDDGTCYYAQQRRNVSAPSILERRKPPTGMERSGFTFGCFYRQEKDKRQTRQKRSVCLPVQSLSPSSNLQERKLSGLFSS